MATRPDITDEEEREQERALVAAARSGGTEGRAAFEALVREHQAWVVRYLMYLLGDRASADDVAQDVFIKAYLSLESFRGDGAFGGWLRTICTRLAYNHRRDNKTRVKYEDQTEEIGPKVQSSDAAAVASRDAMLKVLETLPYIFREVLVLRHVEELSVKEIARLLDIGDSATKMRLSRARTAFQEAFEEMTRT